jgi:hypothetical protein
MRKNRLWILVALIAAATALAWKEFPAMVRYVKIERM